MAHAQTVMARPIATGYPSTLTMTPQTVDNAGSYVSIIYVSMANARVHLAPKHIVMGNTPTLNLTPRIADSAE